MAPKNDLVTVGNEPQTESTDLRANSVREPLSDRGCGSAQRAPDLPGRTSARRRRPHVGVCMEAGSETTFASRPCHMYRRRSRSDLQGPDVELSRMAHRWHRTQRPCRGASAASKGHRLSQAGTDRGLAVSRETSPRQRHLTAIRQCLRAPTLNVSQYWRPRTADGVCRVRPELATRRALQPAPPIRARLTQGRPGAGSAAAPEGVRVCCCAP